MELLERYLKQIERFLPFKERTETTKELRSLILDQVDEQSVSEQDKEAILYNIIVDMGDPREVASHYAEVRPIVSKEMEPILKLVLKIVSITLPLSLLFANGLSYVFNTNDFTFMDFLLHAVYQIPDILYSLLIGYGFIFVIFFLIDRFIQPKFQLEEKGFNPNLLPMIPTKDFKVTIFESVFTILVTVLFLYLINLQPGLFALNFEGTRIPFLNSNFDKLLPFINISWFISIGLHVYYLYNRKKNIPTKTIEMLEGIYSAIVLIFLATSNIINQELLDTFELGVVAQILKIVFIFIAVFIIIASIVEYVKMYINLDALDELDKLKKS